MIYAGIALQLDSGQPSKSAIEECRAMMVKLDQHVRKYMTFNGPTPLEVPPHEMSHDGVRLLCHVMKRFKWQVNANLIAEAPRFAGGQPVPHHWVFQLQPMVEMYDTVVMALTAEWDTAVMD